MSVNTIASQLGGLSGGGFDPSKIDPAKLKEIQQKLKENGGKVPDVDTSKIDQKKFLEQFTKDFGSEAADSIKGKDGKIDFDKVKSFFDDKLASSGIGGIPFGSQSQGTQTDTGQDSNSSVSIASILNSNSKDQAKSLADLLLGNKDDDKKEEKDKGRYVSVQT